MKIFLPFLAFLTLQVATQGSSRFCRLYPDHIICSMNSQIGNIAEKVGDIDDKNDLILDRVSADGKGSKSNPLFASASSSSKIQTELREIKGILKQIQHNTGCPPGCMCIDGCVICGQYNRCSGDAEDLKDEFDRRNDSGKETCESGMIPLIWAGSVSNCSAVEGCPIGFSCEETKNQTMRCCPKSENQTRIFDPIGLINATVCPWGPGSLPLMQNNETLDCTTKRCPNGYMCTIMGPTERFCCENATNPSLRIISAFAGKFQPFDGGIHSPASAAVIETGLNTILFDFGFPMDGKSLLKTYMANDVEISEASYAILSHMHLDHIGSLALLNPHTTLLVNGGNFARGRDFWFTPMTAENGNKSIVLDPNVEIIFTPGHTDRDLSAIVYNVPKMGTVVLSGDAILGEFQYTDNLFPKTEPLLTSFRTLTCKADFVLPGHGPAFKVTDSMRKLCNC